MWGEEGCWEGMSGQEAQRLQSGTEVTGQVASNPGCRLRLAGPVGSQMHRFQDPEAMAKATSTLRATSPPGLLRVRWPKHADL